eukprot:4468144-Prymnesium_polylepis.1
MLVPQARPAPHPPARQHPAAARHSDGCQSGSSRPPGRVAHAACGAGALPPRLARAVLPRAASCAPSHGGSPRLWVCRVRTSSSSSTRAGVACTTSRPRST